MWLIGSKRGLALMEVMVSVAIMSVGLVAIIQAFITAVGALRTAQNRVYARQILEDKMIEIEQELIEEGGVEPGSSRGEIELGNRSFDWSLEISPVEEGEELDLSEELNESRLSVSWQEANRAKDVLLVTYLENKKEEE